MLARVFLRSGGSPTEDRKQPLRLVLGRSPVVWKAGNVQRKQGCQPGKRELFLREKLVWVLASLLGA
jgi:hypothetical protein